MIFRNIFITLISLFCVCCGGPSKNTSDITFNRNLNLPYDENDLSNFLKSDKLTNLDDKKLPNIYLYFFDTLREDFINQVDTPNLLKMKKDSLPYERAFPGATATHHSVFSLFYSRPAYERKIRLDQNFKLGSPFLRILRHHLKYTINTFAYTQYMYCYDGVQKYSQTEDQHMGLIFGKLNDLQDYCQDIKEKMLGDNLAEIESKVITNFIDMANKTDLEHSEKRHFFFIYQAFLHDHVWTSETKNLYTPYDTNLNPGTLYKFPTSTRKEGVTNSYKNSIKEADHQFGIFINYLKSINQYDNSIIIVFSDHGQNLYEKGAVGHGGPPFDEVIRVPLYIKLHKEVNKFTFNPPHYISTMDTFPTVLEALGMEEYGQEFYFGESYFNHSHYSPIITQPAMADETPKFVIINKDYKVFGNIKSNGNDFFDADSFEIESTRNHQDVPIILEENYQNLKRKIRFDFSKTLKKMFH